MNVLQTQGLRTWLPTLMIGLTHDQQVLVENAQEVQRLIPGANYNVVFAV